MNKYRQLTSNERYILAHLKKQGFSFAAIARQLGRHKSTISREIKRNSCWITDGSYRPSKAERRTRTRRREARKAYHYTHQDFLFVKQLIKKRWSPEQIYGYCRRHGIRCMSHETIYQYIWEDKANGGDLWTHLRQSPKQRRKRYGAYDSRGRLANKRSIDDRPEYINSRAELGHWEIDTVMGKGSKHCILTLVERATGYTVIGQLNNKTADEVYERTLKLIKRLKGKVKTITADNGTEFHRYKHVETMTGVKYYFAKPYHSWERGTNENTNGLIRQYIPKGLSMSKLTQQKCNAIANMLNARPRKRYDYKTPNEVYHEL